MPNYRCEFRVTCDLVFGEGVAHTISGADGIEFQYSNADKTDEGHTPCLIITVIGEAPSLEEAQGYLRGLLAQQLDLITFSTHARCRIEEPIRLVEWDPGEKERQFLIFHVSDPRYPPEPSLLPEFLNTSNILDRAIAEPFVRVALKYFRYGVLDEKPEDQFMRFWLALEIIAENTKESTPVPIVCPSCQNAMTCNTCGTAPTRMPMAKKAIEILIQRIVGEGWEEISQRQFKVRNGLTHGSSIESVEAKSKQPLSDSVNELASLVWNAIRINIKLNAEDVSSLVIGHKGGTL